MITPLLVALVAFHGPGAQPGASPELARRADSLAALDPEREARAALRRGDRRLLATCGIRCAPPGVVLTDSVQALARSWRFIAGTTDAVANPDVMRLNRVAGAYAMRYNRVILPPSPKAPTPR